MNNTPKVSIITPVYNAEKYICRCLESIINQSFTDWECILVDDGTPDGSGEICDKYSEQDSRFRVIHKQNGGVASARQIGIDNSRGDYIIHVDADDWVDENMLSELYENAIENNSDIVMCDYFINEKEYVFQKPSNISDNDSIVRDFFGNLHGSCWNKLVRRECIVNNNVSFVAGINYCEDLIFNISLLKNKVRVSYLDKAFYHYYQNDNSIIHNKSISFFQMADKAVTKLETILGNEYANELSFKKISLKADAFYSGVFDKSDFKNYYSEVSPSLIFIKGYSWLTVLFYISCYSYPIARFIYTLLVYIRRICLK